MKKYLLKIGLFFAIIILVDVGYGTVCKRLIAHARGGTMKQVDMTVHEQTADIVIFGSSRAHHHYVPAVLKDTLGLTAYNGGVDGNGIVLAKGLYTVLLNRYHPKVLVYDITNTFDFNGNSSDGSYSTYLGFLRPYFYEEGVKDVVARVDKNERYKNLSSMFRYNSKIVDLIKDQLVGRLYSDGYEASYGELKEERPIFNDDVMPIDTTKMNMLKEIIDQSKSADVEIVFVASPKYSVANSSTYEAFRELCDREQVEFWDYYCEPKFQRTDYFADGVHLNDKGAHVLTADVSSRLKRYLAEKGVI